MLISRRALRLAPLSFVLVVLALCVCAPSGFALGGATRTWVSGTGDDANPCSRTAPCKTFAGAISKTAPGGEIDAIDSGGYGAVTISEPITIDGAGTMSSVLTAGTNGITINITGPFAHPDVVLRNLSVVGASSGGASGCPFTSLSGVKILSAGNVEIDNTFIDEQSQNGISVEPSLLDTHVSVDGVHVSDVCGSAVNAAPGAGRVAHVAIKDSTFSANGTGVTAGAGAAVRVTDSSIVNGGTGVAMSGGGTIDVSRSTSFFGNTADGTPTTIYDAIKAGPTGAAGPSGANAAPPAKLIAIFAAASTSAAKGKKVVLPYASTGAGSATLTVTKGSSIVAFVGGTTKLGRNAIAWNGKVGKKAAAAGTYKLKLTVSGAGQTTTDTTIVKVH